MRPAAAALLVLLLLPLALAQVAPGAAWTNAGGDAARAGVAAGLREPLDVVAMRTVAPELALSQWGTVGLLPMGDALVGAGSLRTSLACALLVIEGGRELAARTSELECANEAHLVAAHGPLAVACTPGSGGKLLHAFDVPSMQALWWHAVDTPAASLDSTYLAGEATEWGCGGGVVRPEPLQLVVPFGRTAGYDNEVVAFSLPDGQVEWRARIGASAILGAEARRASGDLPLVNEVERSATDRGFLPDSLTATSSGLLVVGILEMRAAYATLDPDGTRVSGGLAHADDARHSLARSAAAAQGPLAAFQLGRELVVVDPAAGEERGLAAAPPAEPGADLAAPTWWNDLLLVPGSRTLSALRTPAFVPAWNWTAEPGASIAQVLFAPPASAYVLLTRPLAQEREVTLTRLDVRTGEEVQRLVLTPPRGAGSVRMVPWPAEEGLVVVFADTTVALLGAADASLAPEVRAASLYPALDEPATVHVRAEGALSLRVAWGDGSVEEAPGDEATFAHHYGAARDRTARVTATYPDNRTATTEIVLHVGAAPPMKLTAIQRAFAPERQEATFFLLGLALTGGGALFAGVLRQRRRARLAEEERALRYVVDDSLLNPTKGLAALESHRAHLRDAHTRRRLDDAQFGLLDQRTVRAMKAARYRLLGSALNKLSPQFRRILDTALEDGQVTSGEMAALIASLEDEHALTPLERERVRALLTGWAR